MNPFSSENGLFCTLKSQVLHYVPTQTGQPIPGYFLLTFRRLFPFGFLPDSFFHQALPTLSVLGVFPLEPIPLQVSFQSVPPAELKTNTVISQILELHQEYYTKNTRQLHAQTLQFVSPINQPPKPPIALPRKTRKEAIQYNTPIFPSNTQSITTC